MTDTITLPRATVQQTLMALEDWWGSFPDFRSLHDKVAIAALRTALEQQSEPVAIVDDEGVIIVCSYKYKPGDKLYTAPPQRKELSESEILNMMPSTIPAEYDGELMEFARAVEAKLKEGT